MRTIFQVHQDKALYSDIIRTKIHLASTPGLSCLNGSVCISRLFWHRFPFLPIPMIIMIHLASTPRLSCLNGSVSLFFSAGTDFPSYSYPCSPVLGLASSYICSDWCHPTFAQIGVIIHLLKPSGGPGPVLSSSGSICRGWSQLQVIYRMAILMTILMPILMIILMVVVIKTMTMMIRGALKNMRFYWQWWWRWCNNN